MFAQEKQLEQQKEGIDNKKILFIINVDWFFISHRLPLAIRAIEKNYEVHLACNITDKKEYLERLGIVVHPLNLSRNSTSIVNELFILKNIYQVLKQVNPSIAHFVTIKPVLYGGVASRLLNIRKKVFAISGLGSVFVAQGLKANLFRLFIKYLYQIALNGKHSYVIVQNLQDRKIVLKMSHINKNKMTTINGSGVDMKLYIYTPEIDDIPVVVMASRLLKEKGVFEFAAAARAFLDKNINARFELYGDIDTGNSNSLTKQDLIKISKISNLKVQGFSYDIKSILQNSHIVVLPSYYGEGLPKVLIEAAACGRAIVTTDMPGCRDAIIPNVTGLLCKIKDVPSLVSTIEILLKDHKMRQKMGIAGRKFAEREFDIKNVIEQHFKIYEQEE